MRSKKMNLPILSFVMVALPALVLLGHRPALGASTLKVWAIGDGVRINPLTGKAFEDNSKQLPGGISGDLRSKNLIWNAATKTITVKGAANEVLGLQLILKGSAVKGIRVAASD